ncbi:HXXXD-type acyl-transferase family protein [Perilla frutescens var. frutescens]|nr:HXXXD-type acyl-transferase family protein [Perilla frutescens var. frutescens]
MLLCISGAFHWFPLTIAAYTIIINGASLNPLIFSISVAAAYTAHGAVLTLLTSMLSHSLSRNEETHDHLKMWLRQRLIVACHLRFAKLLSGTEAFCIYLRLLGARVGKFCSIRAINPILEPKLLSIGDGVHLGDFSRIITGFYSSNGFTTGKVDVQENCVVGSQSIVLPGATIEREVILGALSAAPINSVLLRGGVYIGSQSPIMIKNTVHELDERIEEMDVKYKKIVRTRYFHGIGVSEKDASVLSSQVTLARAWHQTVWSIFAQPLMQTLLPYFLLAYVVSAPLKWMLSAHASMNCALHWLLPLFWIVSGVAAAVACALAKWVLVGRKKDGGTVLIWSGSVFMDTVWQAFKTLAGEYFIETTGGSMFFAVWMKLMGAEIDVGGGVYVDSMGAALNPEMVEIGGGGCVGREALLFGHIYEGDGGKVKFGKIRIGEGGFVGSRAVAMPGVVVEEGGSLGALSLAMKGEVVRTN